MRPRDPVEPPAAATKTAKNTSIITSTKASNRVEADIPPLFVRIEDKSRLA